jgi:N-acetylneuraminic acid mutarotase
VRPHPIPVFLCGPIANCHHDGRIAWTAALAPRFARYLAAVWMVSLILLLTPAAQAQSGEWAWISGISSADNFNGVYGTLGVPSAGNVPPPRIGSVSWTDRSGNLWLFGGSAASSGGNSSIHFNDLWEFVPATNEWAWMSGYDLTVGGVYGILGVPAEGNVPGSREDAVGWTDNSGNLWLFGGWGYDANKTFGVLNDLWEFNPSTKQWAWMGGSSTLPNANDSCQPGVYGTLGVAAVDNVPGGRMLAMSWTDIHGNFWLFGGGACDSTGIQGLLNDLWEFSPATKDWTWISGSNLSRGTGDAGDPGIYGNVGIASSNNMPSGRWDATTWADSSGNLWLFGGSGFDSVGPRGYLNDLWKFAPSTNEWTWISGSSVIGNSNCYEPNLECAPSAVYGTLGQYAAGNVPGGRDGAVSAVDASGNLLLFGGANNPAGIGNYLNDLWEFNLQTTEWAWIGGSNTTVCAAEDNQGNCVVNGMPGVYGTLGVPAASNAPGSRVSISWTGKDGSLWIFGGDGVDADDNFGLLNDLWEFQLKQSATVTLTSSASPVYAQNDVTLTATVAAASGTPTGAVTFLDGTASIGTGALNSSGQSTLTVGSLAVGSHALTASYGGDANDFSAVSATVTQMVDDFSINAGPPTTATISPGGSATYTFTCSPVAPATSFPAAITLSASGGPAGATYSFSTATISGGAGSTSVNLTVMAPGNSAAFVSAHRQHGAYLAAQLSLAFLLLPLAGNLRKYRPQLKRLAAPRLLMLLGLAACAGLAGCGGGSAPTSTQPGTYTITVIGAAGPLTHSIHVTLTVD